MTHNRAHINLSATLEYFIILLLQKKGRKYLFLKKMGGMILTGENLSTGRRAYSSATFQSFIPQRVLRRVRSLSKTSPLPSAISASSLIPVPSLFVMVIHNCLRLLLRFSVPSIFPSTGQMKQKYLCFISLVFTLPANQLVVQRYLATIKGHF
jgi:hypothetical protein